MKIHSCGEDPGISYAKYKNEYGSPNLWANKSTFGAKTRSLKNLSIDFNIKKNPTAWL